MGQSLASPGLHLWEGKGKGSSLLGKEGSEDEGGEGKLGGKGGVKRKEKKPLRG